MSHNQQNLSPGTAYVRFMLGSVLTAYGTIQLLREPKSRSGRMLVLFGSMKAAEGATNISPTKAMSTVMEKMMSETATPGAQSNAGTTMNSGTHSNASSGSVGQKNGNIMQMVGNIAQKLTTGNLAQNASSSPSAGANQTSSGVGQNAMATSPQSIGSIAQTLAPQVSQKVKEVAGMTSSSNASSANNATKQASPTGGASTKKAETNEYNASAKGNNTAAKSNTKQPLSDGATNDSNLDASVTVAISKSGQKNPSTPNILQ
jgi:hypothetical protein